MDPGVNPALPPKYLLDLGQESVYLWEPSLALPKNGLMVPASLQ